MKCFTCNVWFWIGDKVSSLDSWESQPDWFSNLWMPIYQHAIRRAFFLDKKNGCGMWSVDIEEED